MVRGRHEDIGGKYALCTDRDVPAEIAIRVEAATSPNFHDTIAAARKCTVASDPDVVTELDQRLDRWRSTNTDRRIRPYPHAPTKHHVLYSEYTRRRCDRAGGRMD